MTIKARAAVLHSAGLVGSIAEQDINLSGAAAWVYAEIPRGSTGTVNAPVRVSASRPSSDATYLCPVLYRFDQSGALYVLGHCGWWDINLDMTLATQ